MREIQAQATHDEFHDNPFCNSNRILDRTKRLEGKMATLRDSSRHMRAAGLAAINPTMGTQGKTPNLSAYIEYKYCCAKTCFFEHHDVAMAKRRG